MIHNIEGEFVIYKNDYGYSTTISRKIEDKWENMYISVKLPKDDDIKNNTHIQINKGFLSFYKDKNGLAKPRIIVMEYTVLFIKDLPF